MAVLKSPKNITKKKVWVSNFVKSNKSYYSKSNLTYSPKIKKKLLRLRGKYSNTSIKYQNYNIYKIINVINK